MYYARIKDRGHRDENIFTSGWSTTYWGRGETTTQLWPGIERKQEKLSTNPNPIDLLNAFLLELNNDVRAIRSGIFLRPLSQAIDDYSVIQSCFVSLEAISVVSMEELILPHIYRSMYALRPEESDDDNDESYQSDEYFLNLHCNKVSDAYDSAESQILPWYNLGQLSIARLSQSWFWSVAQRLWLCYIRKCLEL